MTSAASQMASPFLFQSHAHFDHHSELVRKEGIIANYDVKHVWDPAMRNDSVAYGCFMKAVITKANERKLVYHPAKDCPDLTRPRLRRGGGPQVQGQELLRAVHHHLRRRADGKGLRRQG